MKNSSINIELNTKNLTFTLFSKGLFKKYKLNFSIPREEPTNF